MTKINFDELDERTACVLLACASGPGDPDVDHLVQMLDLVETVGSFLNPPDSGALSPLADKGWAKTAATRLSMRDAQEAFEASERIGARILILGDPESPTQLGHLQERAPLRPYGSPSRPGKKRLGSPPAVRRTSLGKTDSSTRISRRRSASNTSKPGKTSSEPNATPCPSSLSTTAAQLQTTTLPLRRADGDSGQGHGRQVRLSNQSFIDVLTTLPVWTVPRPLT